MSLVISLMPSLSVSVFRNINGKVPGLVNNTFSASTCSVNWLCCNYTRLSGISWRNYPSEGCLGLFRASAEGAPSELVEDAKFVPMNADDPRYGPPVLLLLGFDVEEIVKVKQLLSDLDGEFLKIVLCTKAMINHSLWEAVHTEQPVLEKIQVMQALPRICFFSGLRGEEMMMFIDSFPETGLEPAVFAAMVPNSADKPLQELIEEIMGDHERLTMHAI